MDSNVDVAKNRLAQESKRTKQVSKNTGMCKWYSVIILLLISLVYLIIYYFKKWVVCLVELMVTVYSPFLTQPLAGLFAHFSFPLNAVILYNSLHTIVWSP